MEGATRLHAGHALNYSDATLLNQTALVMDNPDSAQSTAALTAGAPFTVVTAGEALIDLIAQPDGNLSPCLGGAVFNFSRALARQAVPTRYLNPLSQDRFGRQLAASLTADGVQLARPEPVAEVTSLAVVALDARGVPDYAFYRQGVADRAITLPGFMAACDSAAAPALQVVATGCLALSPDDGAVYLPWLQAQRKAGRLVAVDANLRLSVMPDLAAYRAQVLASLAAADLVKASDEDLAGLQMPGATPLAQAQHLLSSSGAQALVLTLGSEGAMLLLKDGRQWRGRDAAPVTVVDTVGAGDCFFAGFLAGLLAAAEARAVAPGALLRDLQTQDASACLASAIASASYCVMQRGCVPPTAADVAQRVQGVEVVQLV